MSVLHQALLAAGLASVAIPIVIHLLMRRRRRPVEWGAMRFVLEAYRRTRRRLLVQRWLLLALRCLLVAALGVAIARPLLGSAASAGAGQGRTVYIVLDNSIASQARDAGAGGADGRGTALDRHLASARALLGSLGEGDRAGLVLAAGPGQVPGTRTPGGPVVMPASSNLRAVEEALSRVRATDAAADLPGAVRAVAQAIDPNQSGETPGGGSAPDGAGSGGTGREVLVVLSDFRLGAADLQTALPRLPITPILAASAPPGGGERGAAGSGITNVGVARVAVLREVMVSGQTALPQTATVELVRSGAGVETAATSRVSLAWLDATGAPGPGVVGEARWTPGQRTASITVAVEAPPDPAVPAASGGPESSPGAAPGLSGALGAGEAVLMATVTGGDALTGDDRWRLPLQTRPSIRVGLVSDDPGRARWGGAGGGGGEGFPAAQWIALALRPGAGAKTGIELSDIDTAAIDASRLAGLDAAFVTTPQRVDDEGWSRLAAFARGGGLLVVVPPADQQVHAWPDAMLAALGLDWTVARQTRVWPEEAPRPRVVASGPGDLASDLLSAVRGELPDLAAAVGVDRLLQVTPGGSSAVQLALDDGSPLVISAPVSAPGSASGSGGGGQRGVVVLLAVALNPAWTDLPAKPLIVPLMQEVVRQGVARSRQGSWSPAGAVATAPPGAVQLTLVRRAADGGEPLSLTVESPATPGLTGGGRTAEPARVAGLYRAADGRGAPRGVLAVNPDAAGARVDAQPREAIEAWMLGLVGGAGDAAAPRTVRWFEPGGDGGEGAGGGSGVARALAVTERDGSPTGPLLLLAVLGLALLELLAARWASQPAGVGGAPAPTGAPSPASGAAPAAGGGRLG